MRHTRLVYDSSRSHCLSLFWRRQNIRYLNLGYPAAFHLESGMISEAVFCDWWHF
jgi:hypothetical protein